MAKCSQIRRAGRFTSPTASSPTPSLPGPSERQAKFRTLANSVFWGLIIPASAVGQSVEERIELGVGWNAVWFNVAPEPNDLVSFLASQVPPLDCQSVWTFEPNRVITADPAADPPGRWLFYDKGTPPALQSLRNVQGHRAYLFKMNVGGTLRLFGRPVIRSHAFSGRVSNPFGAMSNSPGSVLTFEGFFAHPNATGKIVSGGTPIGHDIFAFADGELVRRKLIDAITPNKAYWLNTVQDFGYAGPLDVTSSANGLSFGRSTAIRTLTIDVPSSPIKRTVTIQAHSCLGLNGGDCGATAEGVEWLEFRVASSSPVPEWRPLASGLDVLAPAGTTKINLELRARRATVSAVAGTTSGSPILPPLVIDIADDQGSRIIIPSDVQVEPVFGLWAGKAVLTRVSVHPGIQNVPIDDAEAIPIEMSLILDLPDPIKAAAGTVPKLLDTVTVQTFRDGRSLQRRFSSVLIDRPVILAADGGDPIDPLGTRGTLRGSLRILPEDPLNPYRHRYNPEHRKGYEINRDITMIFDAGDESIIEQLSGLDGTFGPQRLYGFYSEVITGLSAGPITIQGGFRLERIRGGAVTP
jgi:hypothetical protein